MNQMYVPPLSRGNKLLIIAYVACFLAHALTQAVFKVSLVNILGLSIMEFTQGHIYQLVTYPFIDNSLISVVFNALIVWFIGSELESRWGQKFYFKFLALCTYLPGVIYIGLGLSFTSVFQNFHGLTGTNLALLVAYGMVFSERILVFMFVFPMKAKYFCMLLAAMEVFMTLSYQVVSLLHCIAMAVAFFYLRYTSFIARGGSFNELKQKRNRDKMRSKLRLIKEDEPKKPDPENPKYWQ